MTVPQLLIIDDDPKALKLAATVIIRRELPEVRVLIVSRHTDAEYVLAPAGICPKARWARNWARRSLRWSGVSPTSVRHYSKKRSRTAHGATGRVAIPWLPGERS